MVSDESKIERLVNKQRDSRTVNMHEYNSVASSLDDSQNMLKGLKDDPLGIMQEAIQDMDIQQHEQLMETLNNKRTFGSGSMAKVDTSSRVLFPAISKVEDSILILKAVYSEKVAESRAAYAATFNDVQKNSEYATFSHESFAKALETSLQLKKAIKMKQDAENMAAEMNAASVISMNSELEARAKVIAMDMVSKMQRDADMQG